MWCESISWEKTIKVEVCWEVHNILWPSQKVLTLCNFGDGCVCLSEDLLNSFHERSEFEGMLLLIQSDT